MVVAVKVEAEVEAEKTTSVDREVACLASDLADLKNLEDGLAHLCAQGQDYGYTLANPEGGLYVLTFADGTVINVRWAGGYDGWQVNVPA